MSYIIGIGVDRINFIFGLILVGGVYFFGVLGEESSFGIGAGLQEFAKIYLSFVILFIEFRIMLLGFQPGDALCVEGWVLDDLVKKAFQIENAEGTFSLEGRLFH